MSSWETSSSSSDIICHLNHNRKNIELIRFWSGGGVCGHVWCVYSPYITILQSVSCVYHWQQMCKLFTRIHWSQCLYLGKIEKFRLLCGMWWLTGMWTDVTYLSVTRVMQSRHKLNNLSRSTLQSRYYTTGDTISQVTGRCTCWVANEE